MSGSWNEIELQLSQKLARTIQFESKESVSGGCINQAWKVTDTENTHWFVKINSPSLQGMFQAEADGLKELIASACIRAPQVIAFGVTSEFSYLVLEYISLQAHINQRLMGEQLAEMHQYYNSNNQFGWKRDNTIGSTAQSNALNNRWVSFWKNERLLFQLNMAKNKGYPNKAYDDGLKLAESLPEFFTNYQVKPSLLHGDLWGGNCGTDSNSNPVIYDPAVYYGDRETDIAMTELFGGFTADFYNAYDDYYSLDAGYKTRKKLYNLYHILNHYNLFGGGYALQAHQMTKQLLAEL